MNSTMTMTPLSPLNPAASSRAFLSKSSPSHRPQFTSSRPLRPFGTSAKMASSRPTKIIEPPKGFTNGFFVIDMTNDELARRV